MLIPTFVGICFFFSFYVFFKYDNPHADPSIKYPGSNPTTVIPLRAAQACYLIVIVYGLYPIVFSAKSYYKKSYENIVPEFEFTKKILFVGVPILIFLIIISQLFIYFQINDVLFRDYFILYDGLIAILAATIATMIGALLRIAVYTARKEFRLYLARGYCRIASSKESNIDKINYLFLSIDSYNKFLIRKTKLGIKNIDKIYSDIMRTDANKNYEMIKWINEHLGAQTLDLAIYLSKIYKVPDTEQFFIKEALVQKLKTVGAFLGQRFH